jgi:hypothetical protein
LENKRYRNKIEVAALNSFTNNLDQNPLSPFAVKLSVKNLLPGAKIEFPFCDRHDDLSPHHLPFQMGIGIIFSDIVTILFNRFMGSEFLKPDLEIMVWGTPTRELAEQMLSAGLEAYVSSVDLKKLPSHFAGRKWSRKLIAEFPQDCDPCGENGEIHTVVVGGPIFQKTVPTIVGEIVKRNGFAYADIIPIN